MSTEKNALRDKLDDFNYGYREGAWERFEKMLGDTEQPLMPPVFPNTPSNSGFGKKILGISLGLAVAVALLFAGWLMLKPYSGTGYKNPISATESETQTRPSIPEQSSGSEKPAPAVIIPAEIVSTASVGKKAESFDKQTFTKTNNDFKAAKSLNPVKETKNDKHSKQTGNARLKSRENQGSSGLTLLEKEREASSLLMLPSLTLPEKTPDNVPADQVTNVPPGADTGLSKLLGTIVFLPTLLEDVDIQNDSLLPSRPVIRPFVEAPLVWKKHEAGAYMDVAGPLVGNYLIGGEYARNWNTYTQTSLGIAFQYIIDAQNINDTNYGALATHLLATEYVTLVYRPKWNLRLGVGYRFSAIQPVRYSSADPKPQKYAASDKQGLLFSAEYKRQLHQDTWLGLRFSAVHWAPNLNLSLCRQF